MTSWKRNGIVITTVACQLLAGALSGRAIYLSHCGDHGHGSCEDRQEECGSRGCLAGADHDHIADFGHDHRCRCPHFHVRSDIQRAERSRLKESLRRLDLCPAPGSAQASQESPALADGALRPALPEDSGPPQTVRALRSIRLLV